MKKFILQKQKKSDYVQFTCRIEENLLEQVRTLVRDNNFKSINRFINDCIQFTIDNIEIKDN